MARRSKRGGKGRSAGQKAHSLDNLKKIREKNLATPNKTGPAKAPAKPAAAPAAGMSRHQKAAATRKTNREAKLAATKARRSEGAKKAAATRKANSTAAAQSKLPESYATMKAPQKEKALRAANTRGKDQYVKKADQHSVPVAKLDANKAVGRAEAIHTAMMKKADAAPAGTKEQRHLMHKARGFKEKHLDPLQKQGTPSDKASDMTVIKKDGRVIAGGSKAQRAESVPAPGSQAERSAMYKKLQATPMGPEWFAQRKALDAHPKEIESKARRSRSEDKAAAAHAATPEGKKQAARMAREKSRYDKLDSEDKRVTRQIAFEDRLAAKGHVLGPANNTKLDAPGPSKTPEVQTSGHGVTAKAGPVITHAKPAAPQASNSQIAYKPQGRGGATAAASDQESLRHRSAKAAPLPQGVDGNGAIPKSTVTLINKHLASDPELKAAGVHMKHVSGADARHFGFYDNKGRLISSWKGREITEHGDTASLAKTARDDLAQHKGKIASASPHSAILGAKGNGNDLFIKGPNYEHGYGGKGGAASREKVESQTKAVAAKFEKQGFYEQHRDSNVRVLKHPDGTTVRIETGTDYSKYYARVKVEPAGPGTTGKPTLATTRA